MSVLPQYPGYVPENRPYAVRVLGKEASTSNGVTTINRDAFTDISAYVYQIEKMTDTDQDNPQSAQLSLNTIDGAFLPNYQP